ncbi:MAG TPA: hypothetical protein VJN44_13435 [Roseateles sp.]|nr:hypothetical protein [Roseateles sp.]
MGQPVGLVRGFAGVITRRIHQHDGQLVRVAFFALTEFPIVEGFRFAVKSEDAVRSAKAARCVAGLQALCADTAEDRRRIVVDLRLTEPGPIAPLPIDDFDRLERWEHLPRDGRCIKDRWF